MSSARPGTPSAAALGIRGVFEAVARVQIDDLEDRVYRATDAGASTTTLPRFVGNVLLVLLHPGELGRGSRYGAGPRRIHRVSLLHPLLPHRSGVTFGGCGLDGQFGGTWVVHFGGIESLPKMVGSLHELLDSGCPPNSCPLSSDTG